MPSEKTQNAKRKTQNIQPLEQGSVRRRFWIPLLTSVIFLFAFGSGLRILANHFGNLVYPNVFIGEFNLGGRTKAEVEQFLTSRFEDFEKNGYQFAVGDNQITLHSSVTALSDLDLTYPLYTVDQEKTLHEVFLFGKQGSVMDRATRILAQLFTRTELSASVHANVRSLTELLKQNFSSHERPVKQPKVLIHEVQGQTVPDVEIVGVDEPLGMRFDYDRAVENFQKSLSALRSNRIEFLEVPDAPSVTSTELFDPNNRISERLQRMFSVPEIVVDRATSTVTEILKQWKLSREQFASFVGFEKDPNACQGCPAVRIALNSAFDEWAKILAQESEVWVQDAKLVVTDGKIKEFQVARDGLALDREGLKSSFEEALNESGPFPEMFVLPMDVVKPQVQTGDVNDLGIKEIIGVGRSNFKGSPRNRRHNIAVGAAAVNSTLIPPGEEFSLLKVLGEVSGATGYLPELVIKGDRTIPEYGGGLCQIGTTTFRGALASGLPITARTNHSYRVQYYEPAGTDATIYGPAPDFRFINDTGNHILIQTRIEGDDLIFEFWGTKDGRAVEQTKPKIYNIVSPAPTKYVETIDLKPGEEKCTERAHAGADAEFTYTVTYPDGIVKEKVFTSHYRPWQAVCLKGVKELSKPMEEPSPTE